LLKQASRQPFNAGEGSFGRALHHDAFNGANLANMATDCDVRQMTSFLDGAAIDTVEHDGKGDEADT
jgi:hypothetical protein